MDIIYRIQFYTDWICGSGLSAGNDVADLVIKDEAGLPFIPGTTIKGLFREAAEILGHLTEEEEWRNFLVTDFGKPPIKDNEVERDKKKRAAGQARFSNAELTKQVKAELRDHKDFIRELLFRRVASTAIDEKGMAREKSLRKTEVTVPLSLFGKIENCSNERLMVECMKWTKQLGGKRNRGYGRCDITLVREDEK